MLSGESKRATINSEGVSSFDSHICVPRAYDLIPSILHMVNNSRYFIFMGITKMYGDLTQHY